MKPSKKRYSVKIYCEVVKIVTVEAPSEQEARDNPWDYAVDEIEADQISWKVKSVELED